MARCPNCGSSVRTGAKFCTTCGFRLPTETIIEQEPATHRSPFDITSGSSSASHWPPPVAETEPDAGPETETALDVAEAQQDQPAGEAAEEIVPEEDPRSGSAPFTGWPAFGASGEQGGAWERADTVDEAPVEDDRDGDHRQVEEAIASWSSQPAEADEDETSAPMGEPVEERAYSWTTGADSEPAEEPEAEADLETLVGGEPAASADEGVMPEPVELDAVQPVPVEVAAPPAGGASPIARATELIDELQRLLPTIASSGPGDEETASAVAADLEQARNQHGLDPDALASLRAAVATAQARPRDVDIMLDLVGRAGAMSDLLAAYDRGQAAIDAAIKRLRGEADDEPAPRW